MSELPRLAIVVGHTQKAPGASAVAPLSLTEYAYNTQLARAIKGLCDSRAAVCEVFFRDLVGLRMCYERVAAWGPSACAELHFNSHTDSAARGSLTLAGADQPSVLFAREIHAQIAASLSRAGKLDRGVVEVPNSPGERGWFSVNALPECPNCLIEPFFGSSPLDAALGLEKRDELASAVVLGFFNWAGKYAISGRA